MQLNEVVTKASSRPGNPPYKVMFQEVGSEQAPELVLSCTCEGYRHRRSCRHINEVAQQRVRTEPCPSCGATTWSETTTVGGANALICDTCDFNVAW
jgi:hypothetical protein